MVRQHNTSGGGSQTNHNGLKFERDTDFSELVSQLEKYSLEEIIYDDKKKYRGFDVYRDDKFVGKIVPHTRFYDWLKEINLENTNAKHGDPDECFINYENKTVYIIEKKWQQTSGSVDEKLFGFGNKRRLYQRILDSVEDPFSVQFVFVGNDFFKQKSYRNYFEMLRGDGVKIMIDEYDMVYFSLY